MNLTTEQARFVSEVATGETSISLEAVAGSGKTTTLLAAVQQIPRSKSVLAVAFNSKTKLELERKMPGHVDCLTLNSLGHRAWQGKINKRLTLNQRKVGMLTSQLLEHEGIRDNRELWDLLKDWVAKAKAIGIVPNSLRPEWPQGLHADTPEVWIAVAERFDLQLPESEGEFEGVLQAARTILAASCQAALEGTVDFDDQLYMTVCWNAPLRKYFVVLVDEAQDLSTLQHIMVERSVAVSGGRVIAVGDSRQAIYGFRGAASDSMELLRQKFSMQTFPLTFNFRCGSRIVSEAARIVPQIQAPANAWEGSVAQWEQWQLADLPRECTILCRNVAPLAALGYKLILNGKAAFMMGRDLGAGYVKVAQKLTGHNAEELLASLRAWHDKEVAKARKANDLDKESNADDKFEVLLALLRLSKATTAEQLVLALKRLFDSDNGTITLSTIHRAKGLEWDTVIFLDKYRIPSKHAQKAVEADPEGCAWMLEQEKNLKYIAITRAKQKLIYAELNRCAEFKKDEEEKNGTE